jgi:hypothetical protein
MDFRHVNPMANVIVPILKNSDLPGNLSALPAIDNSATTQLWLPILDLTDSEAQWDFMALD